MKHNPENRIGEVHNGLTIVGVKRTIGHLYYVCKCVCGEEKNVKTNNLNKLNCFKCYRLDKYKHLIGQKKGKLTAVEIVFGKRGLLITVLCDCGNKYNVRPHVFEKIKSCCKCRKGYVLGQILENGVKLVEYLDNKIYLMKCHCGKLYESVIRKYNGKHTDCGCSNKNKIFELAKSKIGEKYGYLKVNKLLGNLDGHYIYEMKCKCGNKILRKGGHFGKSLSCGCVLSENLPTGENAKRSKYKNIDVKSARELHESGLYSIEEISEIVKIPKNYLNRILKKNVWKHV